MNKTAEPGGAAQRVGGSSLFSQALALVDRRQFLEAVDEHGAERNTKGFRSWDQFVAMLFGQFAQCGSLREITCGLGSAVGKLKHLGLEEAPSRSTLAYANQKRPWQVFEAVFHQLLGDMRSEFAGTKKFRFRNKLYSMDGSVIDLCASVFPWATYMRTKGAVKLHLLLDHDGPLPVMARITTGNESERKIARSTCFAPGSIVSVDRGYVSYELFKHWIDSDVFFVVRPRRGKTGMNYEVIEERDPPGRGPVLADEIIQLTSKAAKKARITEDRLRLVTVWNEEKQCEYQYLTNNLKLGATTIASIYRSRWEIEKFFRVLKQNTHVKSFLGTTANAVRTQIWTALIAMLIVFYLKRKSRQGWSTSNLVAMLRMNLVAYRDIWRWLDDPYSNPSATPDNPRQSLLPFPGLGQQKRGNPKRRRRSRPSERASRRRKRTSKT